MMNRLQLFFFISLLFFASELAADLDSGIFGSEQMAKPQEEAKRPFSFYASYDYVGSSKFDEKHYKDQSQSFSEAELELGAVFYHNACCQEGAQVKIGYTRAFFDWDENPYFTQQHFNYASLELGFATERVRGWLWQANVSWNMDTDHFQLGKYSNYDLLLWGRYKWNRCVGYHVGFLAYAGMSFNKVWPVLGFDWQINDKWKLNAIYPLNMSLVYQINCNFSASLAGRAFINRYRAGEKEVLPEAIFEYRNTGVELALDYTCFSRIKLNGHAGFAFGGQVCISDRSHHNRKCLNINSAPYIGAKLDMDF